MYIHMYKYTLPVYTNTYLIHYHAGDLPVSTCLHDINSYISTNRYLQYLMHSIMSLQVYCILSNIIYYIYRYFLL